MTSRERLLAALAGENADHLPFTAWCFGLPAHPDLAWSVDGIARPFWYSLRMEHLHTTPHPWTLEDDFRRVLAWRKLGVDDLLDVSVPWSVDPETTFVDTVLPTGQADPAYPVIQRLYTTPSGSLRQVVRLTGEESGPGWVLQPRRPRPGGQRMVRTVH